MATPPTESAAAFDQLVADLHDHLTTDPNACVAKGVGRHLDELPDPSREHAEATLAEARALLGRVEGLDRDGLTFDQRLDLELATLMLGLEEHVATLDHDGLPQRVRCPRAGDAVGDGIFLMLATDPRPAAQKLEDITRRLERVPGYLEALLAELDTPMQRWVDMDVDKVRGLPTLFGAADGLAAESEWTGRPRLAAARAAAEAALSAYAERLAAGPTTTALHLGEGPARKLVALKGIERSLEELHVVARDFLAETADTIETLRGRLVAKYGLDGGTDAATLHSFLNERFRVHLENGELTSILDRYARERDALVAWLTERDLFPIFEEQALRILETPAFMAPSIPAGAMMPPAPFREGVRTSLVYLTLRDDLIDEHTELSIPTMMLHEGIPGHHLQLATASTHPSVIRRHMDAMDQAEGWTTMLEDYLLDLGYMGDLTDEARFCGKRDLSRIGARVAIDLFFMTGERDFLDVGVDCDLANADPFAAAGSLLQTVTGFVPGRVKAELNWYSQERGYPLCYLTGNRLVWELKRDIAAAQAGRLEGLDLDRAFHRTYLQSGNMPVAKLRRVFQHEGLLPA